MKIKNLILLAAIAIGFSVSAQNSGEELFNKALSCGQNGQIEQMVQYLKEAAELGHVDAQFEYGACLYYGSGIEQNQAEAADWYRKAAEKGHPSAQCDLGLCYYTGNGVTKDYTEAVKWYRKAAEQGNAQAQFNMGICHQYGYGVKQCHKTAFDWFNKATEQNHRNAYFMVAEYFLEGEIVEYDEGQALACWHSAAVLGHPYAQYRMGQCYQSGFGGVFKDTTIAKYWYELAAEQGVEEAYDALQTLK